MSVANGPVKERVDIPNPLKALLLSGTTADENKRASVFEVHDVYDKGLEGEGIGMNPMLLHHPNSVSPPGDIASLLLPTKRGDSRESIALRGGPRESIAHRDVSAATAKNEQNVDEMKIQTMYKMVEECDVQVQGMQVKKKMLYLTNKQASLFDEPAMLRCIQALDIGDPKFVIRLLPSIKNFSLDVYAHAECNLSSAQFKALEEDAEGLYCNRSEFDEYDERIINSQLIIFMRTCVVPLAKQTKALILISGANDCYLGAALASIALQEQARMGKDCPFHVLATAYVFEVHYSASNTLGSVAHQIMTKSTSWSIRQPAVNDFILESFGDNQQQCDLSPAASHYIIFESFDPETNSINRAPKKAFEAILLQCITRKLPSIAVQTMAVASTVPHLVELSQRSIPVLILDCDERAFSTQRKVGEPVTHLAKAADTFPFITKSLATKLKIEEHGGLHVNSRAETLRVAMQMLERKWNAYTEAGRVDIYGASTIAFVHSALQVGSKANETGSSRQSPLHQRIKDMMEMAKANKDTAKNLVPSELASLAVNYLQTDYHNLVLKARIAKIEKWLDNHEPSLDHLVEEAKAHKKQIEDELDGKTPSSVVPGDWLALYEVFTAANIFSGSIFDIDELKRVMGGVAKIDRLPAENSLQALKILADCWDHSELYHSIGSSYKSITKVTYHLLLILGMFVTVFSIMDTPLSAMAIIVISFISSAIVAYITFMNPALRWQQLRIAALSIESNVWMFRTRSGPYRADNDSDEEAEKLLGEFLRDLKQSVLEGADLKSTSFYARAQSSNLHQQHATSKSGFGTLDQFSVDPPIVTEAEDSGNVVAIDIINVGSLFNVKRRASVVVDSGGDGLERLEDVIYKIRMGHAEGGGEDDTDKHYQPVQPDFYIRHRVHKTLCFYKSRIPICNHTRNFAQLLMVLGSLLAGAISYFGYARYAAIISITSSAITAYLEFNGTNTKITRYSATVNGLQELILWWDTLPSIDKSAVQNIDRLVMSCEEILQREQQAWRSTNSALRIKKNIKISASDEN